MAFRLPSFMSEIEGKYMMFSIWLPKVSYDVYKLKAEEEGQDSLQITIFYV